MQDIKKKFWIEKFDCFSITGKDARKFLNGITTCNILDSENKFIKTCWLTPNGVLTVSYTHLTLPTKRIV